MASNTKVKTARKRKDGQQPASAVKGDLPGTVRGQKDQRSQAVFEALARHEAALAQLGRRALAGIDPSVLIDEAVSLVAQSLRAEYCAVLELLPDASAFTVRAGVGWKEGVVGQAKVSAYTDSQAGYTLLRTQTVVVEDLSEERRFTADPLLHDHGVVSGMSVTIRGEGQPFGVLSVHTARRCKFAKDDVAFLQDVAEMLATSIERKRAEERSLLFASIFNSVQVGLAVWYLEDPNDATTFKLVSTNPALTGSDPALLQAAVAEDCAEVVRSGKGKELGEVRCGDHDGPQTVFSAKAFPLPNNHVGVAFDDITERRRGEEDVRKLSRAVEQSPSIITITDAEGNIEYVNPKFTQVTGYAFEEVIGKNPRILKSGETPPEEYKRLWAAITSGREWRGEFHNKKKNGELYWASASILPIRDREGLITHFLGVEEDITERRRAEEALRESEASLVEAQRVAHVGNWDWNIVTNDLAWSDEIYRIFGLKPREFGATYEAFLSTVHPDDREYVQKSVDQAVHEGKPYSIDHRIVLPEGEVRTVHEQGEVTFDKIGTPIRMVGVVQDITERRRAEEEIRSLNVELERRVAEQEISIGELSTPVVKLWDEIVLLPLIGVVDTERAQQLIEAMLNAIVETQARVAILDITGVPGVDTSVAQHMIRTVAAAKMLGAEVIVTGVSPEAAQALVKLGVDLSSMRTRGTLRTGLAEALSLVGRQVVSR